jgi:hypothetical protein
MAVQQVIQVQSIPVVEGSDIDFGAIISGVDIENLNGK